MRYCTKYYRTSWRCAPGLGEIWDILRLETDLELSTDMVVDALPPKIKIEKQNKKSWSELSLGRACSAEYSFCKRKDKGSSESAVCPRKLSCVLRNLREIIQETGNLSSTMEGKLHRQTGDCHDLLWSHSSVRKTEGASQYRMGSARFTADSLEEF